MVLVRWFLVAAVAVRYLVAAVAVVIFILFYCVIICIYEEDSES